MLRMQVAFHFIAQLRDSRSEPRSGGVNLITE